MSKKNIREKSIFEQINKLIREYLLLVIVIVAITASTTWTVANEFYKHILENKISEIDELNGKIEKLNREIDDLNGRPYLLPNNLSIKITSPKNGDRVSVLTIVRGTFSGEMSNGWYSWVILNPHTSPGLWWPQSKRIEPLEGRWNIQAWFGNGKEFDIAVVLVNEKDDQYYSDYIKKGSNISDYPGIPLPDSAIIMDIVTVTKI